MASASASEQRLADLERLTDSGLGYLSLEETLAELLDRIRSGLQADTAAVLLMDEDRRVLRARAARGLEEAVREGVQVPLGRGFAGRVALEGRPIMIEDITKAEIVNPLLRQKGICSLLGVPLRVEGRVLGVLHVGTLTPRRFTEDDTRLLQLAGDRAALAIENARLTEQRAVTEIMQRALLPEALAQIPGLRFSAKYLPAGSAVHIGGDWYDAFQLADGRIALVVGDVVGRGMRAASVMAEIRAAIRAYLLEGHDLASVMSLLNDLLGSLGRNRSATAAIFALDLESEELTAVSAGHLPALLIDPDGTPRLMDRLHGLPLGIGPPSQRYDTERVPFPPGSALLLYTDGLIARRSEPIDRGLERLVSAAVDAFSAVQQLTLADRVYRALRGGISPEDDVALLAVESTPLGPRLELELEAIPSALAGMRRAIGRWLRGHGVPDEARFDITVAASEAASNAIEHAYGPREASFDVECAWSGRAVTVTVRDRGSWQHPRHSGGRGLMMMDRFADSVEIDRGKRGTTVRLTKRLRTPA